ncbi:MAG TPA: ATP synthase F1 subunit gamma, partial [Candidatus Paceibacterota bacterium]|nr:ATP synthase F1 subunit gamma [Candidatus Paceibacterota bacterium]
MAGTKEIKRRIRSVKNIKKITKAMELVAAAKMKRAVASTLASRLYAQYSWDVITSIGKNIEKAEHPFFVEREAKNVLLVLITSNRGLCGAYNTQVGKKALAFLRGASSAYPDASVDVATIGKKGEVMMRRLGKNIIASFSDIPDTVNLRDIMPVSNFITEEYSLEKYDRIIVTYTDFVSALTQKPKVKQIMPVSRSELRELIETLGEHKDGVDLSKQERKTEYLFEGDQKKMIGMLAEKLVNMQIYQMILESRASEQSSRMMAMKNASDAAGEMIDDFTLLFNKARQAGIT